MVPGGPGGVPPLAIPGGPGGALGGPRGARSPAFGGPKILVFILNTYIYIYKCIILNNINLKIKNYDFKFDIYFWNIEIEVLFIFSSNQWLIRCCRIEEKKLVWAN